MTKRTRRTHSPGFKAKVALAATKGEKTLAEFGYHVLRQIGADGMPTTDSMVIDPDEAAIIRRIFDAYTGGQSPRGIGKL